MKPCCGRLRRKGSTAMEVWDGNQYSEYDGKRKRVSAARLTVRLGVRKPWCIRVESYEAVLFAATTLTGKLISPGTVNMTTPATFSHVYLLTFSSHHFKHTTFELIPYSLSFQRHFYFILDITALNIHAIIIMHAASVALLVWFACRHSSNCFQTYFSSATWGPPGFSCRTDYKVKFLRANPSAHRTALEHPPQIAFLYCEWSLLDTLEWSLSHLANPLRWHPRTIPFCRGCACNRRKSNFDSQRNHVPSWRPCMYPQLFSSCLLLILKQTNTFEGQSCTASSVDSPRHRFTRITDENTSSSMEVESPRTPHSPKRKFIKSVHDGTFDNNKENEVGCRLQLSWVGLRYPASILHPWDLWQREGPRFPSHIVMAWGPLPYRTTHPSMSKIPLDEDAQLLCSMAPSD